MNNNLAPAYKKLFGEYWVLWYEISNSYSIVEPKFILLLESYLESNSKADFLDTISNHISVSESNSISETLFSYLQSCNEPYNPTNVPSTILNTPQRNISETYTFDDKSIKINYDSELVKKIVHPALANYCKGASNDTILATFDLYLKNEDLLLFKDEQLISSVSKHSYHIIQGKFIMHLLCTLYNNLESDWIGTFHGSTITDGNSSILFIGDSGKGKSTLCALLVANGFHLLADDVSPLLSKDEHIYYNPSAISIKKGAFNLLEPLVNNFEDLPIVKFNKTKGDLKYMPCNKPKKDHYPCAAITLVNYNPKSKTKLEKVSIKTILETIIPDSWLSPNPMHAMQFLDWLGQLELYQLTYSDTKSVTAEVSNLFQQLNKKR
ncbi:hypothetical protein [Winogradskyella schleiferi]|uniref:hypothetical protein n=1 Tax=Winogradskyella schleiferi TaxID=2686078 RepID=UPI0015BD935E|nr:hypothetical protein [Winogradskyella schleiferi]